MVSEGQLVAALLALWGVVTALSGVIYRDMKAQIVAERTGCDRERAKDAARLAQLEAENRELEGQTRAMATKALEAMAAVSAREATR